MGEVERVPSVRRSAWHLPLRRRGQPRTQVAGPRGFVRIGLKEKGKTEKLHGGGGEATARTRP
ncbi:hypothetical protein GCM10010390_40000 [Streptomyces mordarskii]|uniref:Uncharacterized protein n=1 Tax=Streptomyces mordarskii TaxID=1226758 RepID=A0ABN1D4P6_9ACTN